MSLGRLAAPAFRGAAIGFVLVLALVAVAKAGDDAVLRLARSSVDASFVPDPANASRDLVTGRSRTELEKEAEGFYATLLQADPGQFNRLQQRTLGERSAADLDASARAELAAGRPASAQLAWSRLAAEHPDAAETPGALVHLAATQREAGDLPSATRTLARVPDLDLRSAAQAAPLMSRLLAETEERLAREGQGITGRTVVRLQPSIEARNLDEARRLLEWTSGWALVDEVAGTLKIETSGDLLRRAKNVGGDSLTFDAMTQLVPRAERVAGIRNEELLASPGDRSGAETRAAERSKGKLEHWEQLSTLHRLQVALLGNALESLAIDDDQARLGTRATAARTELVAHMEHAARRPDETSDAEARAVARLLDLADANRDGRLTPLWDDEGLWRPKRLAVEGDMRNAVDKPLDDDNAKRSAEFFERTGYSEKALFVVLVRASTTASRDLFANPRVDPSRVDALMKALHERGTPVFAAAHPQAPQGYPGDIERDYLARLSVLRLPGESLDDVLQREILDDKGPIAGGGALAADREVAPLVMEFASLGSRAGGAWIYLDDDVATDAGGPRTAQQKFERAQVLRAQIDDVAASRTLTATTRHLVADLESQGMRFSPGDVQLLDQSIQHQDLGTLALTFDGSGGFSGLDHVVGFTEPGTKLGDRGPGHMAYGFGLDVLNAQPAGNVGWRGSKDMSRGSTLSYHFGAVGLPPGPSAGVSARFRQRKVWQPEVGLNAAVVRGLGGRGFLNLIRDVNVLHERALAKLCADHETAKLQGRDAFVTSMLDPAAAAKPATLFTSSLGYSDTDLREDPGAYHVLNDSYALEKARQQSSLNRKAWPVRFGGWSFDAAFFSGDIFLLGGPRLALKDFRLFSHYVDGPTRRVQSEEAGVRRASVDLGAARATSRKEMLQVELEPRAGSGGEARVVATSARLDVLPGTHIPIHPDFDGTPLPIRIASLSGIPPSAPEPRRKLPSMEPSAADEALELAALNRHLAVRGVPARLRATGTVSTCEIVPAGLTPWCSASLEAWVDDAAGLALSISPQGLPLLTGPPGGSGLVVDWLAEERSVSQAHESDEIHRLVFSLAPGKPAADVIEGSAHFLRTEVVNGRVIGTARVETRYRDAGGKEIQQANVVKPGEPGAAEIVAGAAVAARAAARVSVPDLPPVTLTRPVAFTDDGTISDPAALDPEFLSGLERASPADVTAFKERSIEHSRFVSEGTADGALDPDNVAYIQSHSVAMHGRPLSGDALQHAYFVLVHDGLFRADQGTTTQQVAFLEQRALTPFGAGREIEGAPDARTHALMQAAGVDERAALDEVQGGVRRLVVDARMTGTLPREQIPAGTRILTASESRAGKGVQWTTASTPVDAHLLPPFSLGTNTGRYLASLALGPEVPALDAAIRSEIEEAGDASRHDYDIDGDLVPALGRALAAPTGPREIVAHVAGLDLTVTFAQDGRAGALARCKNATLFPPAWGALLGDVHDVVIAAAPVAWVGTAEAAPRIAGKTWAGWRFLPLLAGLPFLLDDDNGGTTPPDGGVVEPPPEPVPPRDGVENPGAGRAGRPSPPSRPVVERPEPPPPTPRDGGEPPPGGRNPRPDPPGRPKPPPPPPDDNPPRDGVTPPPNDGTGRDTPPEPPDRPRRPVD